MKRIFSIFAIFSMLAGVAQTTATSFYFDISNLDSTDFETAFEESWQGYFDIENTEYKQLIIAEDSISVRFGTQIILPKSEAVAKGFTFKEDKMYGMAPLNGVYYAEMNDTIIALYYQYDTYLASSCQFMKLDENNYLLFHPEENDLYSIDLMTRDGDKLSIGSVDHSDQMENIEKFKKLDSKMLNGFNTYIAAPKIKEIAKFAKKDGFNDIRWFELNKELTN
ncbi:MAG: hypothetical protein ACI8Q1_003324 [Parvicella sp.]|jgi:hypothetical protein